MRVLHLTLSAARGGRRDAILTLIDHLRPIGAECGLVALRNPQSEVADLAVHLDYYDGLEFAGRPTMREILEVDRVCRERQVDMLHAHDAGSQFVASVLRTLRPSLGAVMTFHRTLGIESEGLRNKTRNAISLPRIQRVVTATEERRTYFLGATHMSPRKAVVIPFGVDLRQFHPAEEAKAEARAELGLAPDTTIVLAIGHFGPEKGIDQVIEAVAAAKDRMGDRPWQLVVLGSGAPARVAAIRDLGASLLGERVSFLGFRHDAARWLQAADLLVHAPRLEAFGLVVIQAMASGLPIVATVVGGLPEIIVDGRTGHLVKAGDIGKLAAAVAQLATNPGTRRRLGDAGLLRARQLYSASQTAERHMDLYQSLTAKPMHAAPVAS